MCPIASLSLLQRLKESMSGDERDLKKSRRELSSSFFFPARQDGEGNSRHSDINTTGTCTIVCYRQKLGGKV